MRVKAIFLPQFPHYYKMGITKESSCENKILVNIIKVIYRLLLHMSGRTSIRQNYILQVDLGPKRL